MKKNTRNKFKLFSLISVLILFLIGLGILTLRSQHMTPALHYMRGLELMEKGQQNQALTHLLLANKSSDPAAKMFSAYQLAQLYHLGRKGIQKDIKKAVFYYEEAASFGFPKAQYNLALLYNTGDKVPENREKAFHYMEEAAKILPEAKYVLGVWLEQGYLGEKNKEKALILYEQAADAGVQNAIRSLIAVYHMEKEQTPENIERERYWRNRLKGTQNDVS